MRNYKKIFVVIGLVALVVMFSATGMHRFVILHNIGDQHASLQGLPDTAVIVNAGSRIGRISFLAGILSPGLLVALALLGVFPLVVRRGLTFSAIGIGKRCRFKIQPQRLLSSRHLSNCNNRSATTAPNATPA